MRPVHFLVPGTTGRFLCGGLLVELQAARLVSRIAPVHVVTYRQREANHLYLDDLLRIQPADFHEALRADTTSSPLWIVSWGFDVPMLLRRLEGRLVAYHAHSSGYGFDLPPGVPVLAVSRNTLGYWGDRAPRNPLFLLPNAIESQWLERGARLGAADASGPITPANERRSIDVLVQQRKSSVYVLERLVPALRAKGLRVEVQSGWVDDLVELFNNSSVYLYDSTEYWKGRGVSEGFGLPPLEAMSCGCVVFSSLNHALADTLDPGTLGHQIGFGCLEADVERIAAAVAQPADWLCVPEALQVLLDSSSENRLLERWNRVLRQMEVHWSWSYSGSLALKAASPTVLRWRRRLASLKKTTHRILGRSVC